MIQSRKPTACDRSIFIGLAIVLFLSPLMSGTGHEMAYGLFSICISALLFLWIANALFLKQKQELTWVRTPANWLLVALPIFVCLQLIPFPNEWIQLVSPQTAADKLQAAGILAAAADTPLPDSLWVSLAYHSHSAIVVGVELVCAMGIFFLVLNTANSKDRIDALIYILLLAGTAKAVYGVYQAVFGIEDGWQQNGADSLMLTNMMTFGLALGMLISQRQRSSRVQSGLKGVRASLQRFLSHFSPESSRPRMVFLSSVAVLTGATLIAAESRGAVLAFGVSLLAASVLLLSRKRVRSFGYGILAVGLFVSVSGLYRGASTAVQELPGGDRMLGQASFSESGLPMAKDYPFAGVGMGNFDSLMPRYRQSGPADEADNGWLVMGAETGIVGSSIIVSGLIVFVIRLIRVWSRRRDYHALGVGAAGFMGLAGFAAVLWFGCDLGAALPFAATMAIAYLAVHRQGRGPSESFFNRQRSAAMTGPRRVVSGMLSLLVLGLLITVTGRYLLAEAHLSAAKSGEMASNRELNLAEIDRAIALNPWHAEYHCKRASVLRGMRWRGKSEAVGIGQEALGIRQKAEGRAEAKGSGEEGPEVRDRRSEVGNQRAESLWAARDEAEFLRIRGRMIGESLERAVVLNPANDAYWYELGQYYRLKSDDPYDYISKWLPLADECFDVALKNSPYDNAMLNSVGRYWLWRASILEGAGEGQKRIKTFQSLFRRSLSLNAGSWKRIVDWVWAYYPDDMVVLGCVPKKDTELRSKTLAYLIKREKSF